MDTKITKVNENPLLDRKDLTIEISHENKATPAKEDVKSRIAAENDLDEDKVEVKNVLTGYGKQKSQATLQVYQDFEYDEELAQDTISEEKEQVQVPEEVKELVDNTITEVKDELEDSEDKKLKQALKAEKRNKKRTTLIQWIKDRLN